MPKTVRASAFALAAAMLAAPALAGAPSQPVAPLRPVTDTYFGTAVTDNYRYMEDLKQPDMQAWMKQQADFTRATLDALPGRTALADRIHALMNQGLRRFDIDRYGQRYFYLTLAPGAETAKLYYRDGTDGAEHLLIDPATEAKAGSHTHYTLDFYQPSPDGKLVAYGLSTGGSEASVLHIVEVDSGKILTETIDRTSGNVISWLADTHSFFYLRYPKPTSDMPASETQYNARAYRHRVGANASGDGDELVFGRGVSPSVDVPDGQGTYIVTSTASPYAIAVANHNMDDNPKTLFVAPLASIHGTATPWRKLADVGDGVTQFALDGDRLYFISLKGSARGKIAFTTLAHPDIAHAHVLVPEGHGVISEIGLAREGLYVRESDGALTHLSWVSLDDGTRHDVPAPFEGDLYIDAAHPADPGIVFNAMGWTKSRRIFRFDPAAGTPVDTGLQPPASVDTSDLESKEVYATSYDGTRIPLSLIYRKGLARDGSHPVLMEGYGSYGVILDSYFDPSWLAWIEHNGIIAFAHVRGGGEFGDDWHNAGRKLTKLNTIEDFIACGQYLVDQHYTVSARLAGLGASAGGITIGGALTWRPDLFGVIIDEVGMSDTLRSETEPNGPPNVTEFGSTKTEDGFHGLYAMSAYEHVRDGVAYPAVLFATGINDPRVAPWHMAKMAARVQAATSSKRPVLLRVDYDAGHGIGSTRSQEEQSLADLWAFALWQMGDPAFQPHAGKP